MKLENNCIGDEMLAAILFAAYMNPDFCELTIINNYIQGITARTFFELNSEYKNKVTYLNISSSCKIGDNVEPFLEEI